MFPRLFCNQMMEINVVIPPLGGSQKVQFLFIGFSRLDLIL